MFSNEFTAVGSNSVLSQHYRVCRRAVLLNKAILSFLKRFRVV